MATHSSVLAWRIPGMVEPGGLPSMGLHRVRHNWSNLAAAASVSAPQVALVVKNLPVQETQEIHGLIPGLGRYFGGVHDNPLQYSCLRNSMDRGAWWTTVHGAAKRHNWAYTASVSVISQYSMLWIITVYLTIPLVLGIYGVSIFAFADGAAINTPVCIPFCFCGIQLQRVGSIGQRKFIFSFWCVL